MSDPAELDELESGLTSGFWARFQEHAASEWGPAGLTYQQAIQRATTGPVGSEAEAVQRLKVVAAQFDAIQRLLQWPQARVSQIRGHVDRAMAAAGPSRRGAGL